MDTRELRAQLSEQEPPAAVLIDEERAVTVVRGLAHVDVLQERLAAVRVARLAAQQSPVRTAAERHVRECGHELAYGCCSQGA